jgi:hypothetical protein
MLVRAVDLATNKKVTVSKKDLRYIERVSLPIPFLGINYIVSSNLEIRNTKGDIAPLTEESRKLIIEKYNDQFPNIPITPGNDACSG